MLCNMYGRDPEDQVGLGNIWAEVLLLGLDAVLIAALMANGLEIANMETGRVSCISVEKEVISEETARIVPEAQVGISLCINEEHPTCFLL